MSQATKILAFDIGGTKIASAIVGTDGSLHHIQQLPTPQNGPEKSFELIAEMAGTCMRAGSLAKDDILGIGFGIPAALEPGTDRILWAPNIEGWRDVDLKGYLEAKLGIPACLEYDGHTAVLGEYWQGAGKGYDSVLDVIIGTGVGAGAVVNGHLLRGKNRLAGALGWQVLSLDPAADDLNSEKLGYWESLTAGPGIARYACKTMREDDIIRLAGSREQMNSKILFDAARNGDPAASAVTDKIAKWIGLGVSNALSMLNPDVVVFGGNVGKSCDFIIDRIAAEARHWAQPFAAADVRFCTSNLGTDAGIYGAAYAVILRSNE